MNENINCATSENGLEITVPCLCVETPRLSTMVRKTAVVLLRVIRIELSQKLSC